MSRSRDIADLGGVTTRLDQVGNSDGALSNRNLIINGAMQVAQRGTSATTFAYGTVDRFRPSEGSTSSLAITQTQDANAPSGFSNSLKITVNTAETMSGSKQLAVFHAMEAQNLQQLGYGTSDAQSVTVSFWVKSSVTGAYCLSLYENDDNRNIGATYTINSANTWEYKTITFPPDTVGVIDSNNGAGLETYFFLSVGPDRKTADNNSWATWSAARFGYGQVADVAGTTNATWQITGVQLEVGDTSTDFEHISFGDQLQKCQRFYYQVGKESGAYMANVGFPRGGGFLYLVYATVGFPTEMRATPTLGYGGNLQGVTYSGGYSAVTTTGPVVGDGRGKKIGGMRVQFPSDWTAGDEVFIKDQDGTGFISYDAEL